MTPDFAAVNPIDFGPPRAAPPRRKPGRPGVPSPLVTRAERKRLAFLKEAADVLAVLPADGESLWAIMTGFFDLMQLLIALLDKIGPAERMRAATLSLSARNATELGALLDRGTVRSLDVLVSDFFRRHDRAIFATLLSEVGGRGGRVAAARSHCKIVTVAARDGRLWTLTGSANLRTNHNAEQLCLTRDPDLFAWCDHWLDEVTTRHAVQSDEN
jgi:hypothetical protein